jgi:hypothetical protein
MPCRIPLDQKQSHQCLWHRLKYGQVSIISLVKSLPKLTPNKGRLWSITVTYCAIIACTCIPINILYGFEAIDITTSHC